MLKIDVISGFLGAGKTTFIKRLLNTELSKENIVLIENEFGEVSIDGNLFEGSGIKVNELSQGCICCSLVGDFTASLNEVIEKYNPDRIIIEPSGVGKLSDIVEAIKVSGLEKNLNTLICLVDASKAKVYEKNFGEFFNDQIENAYAVILSRTDTAKNEKVSDALEIIRKHNEKCVIISTPIEALSDDALLQAYEGFDVDLLNEIKAEIEQEHEECCGHHHHDHDEEECCGHHHHDHDEEGCCCGHHHHDHDEEECCGHHHHDHDEEECCGHHHHDHDEEECCGHHHHDHDEEECCGHHHHDHDEEECGCGHHHHHHADEVFESVGIETAKKYDINELKTTLDKMANGEYGLIVRAKGIICGTDNKWYVFQLTENEVNIEEGKSIPTAKICVIGSHIDSNAIKALFR